MITVITLQLSSFSAFSTSCMKSNTSRVSFQLCSIRALDVIKTMATFCTFNGSLGSRGKMDHTYFESLFSLQIRRQSFTDNGVFFMPKESSMSFCARSRINSASNSYGIEAYRLSFDSLATLPRQNPHMNRISLPGGNWLMGRSLLHLEQYRIPGAEGFKVPRMYMVFVQTPLAAPRLWVVLARRLATNSFFLHVIIYCLEKVFKMLSTFRTGIRSFL